MANTRQRSNARTPHSDFWFRRTRDAAKRNATNGNENYDLTTLSKISGTGSHLSNTTFSVSSRSDDYKASLVVVEFGKDGKKAVNKSSLISHTKMELMAGSRPLAHSLCHSLARFIRARLMMRFETSKGNCNSLL